MAEYLKDPNAALRYAVDWTANYLLEDSITMSNWQVTPIEAGGLTVDQMDLTGNVASARFSGGIAGHVYRVTNQITLASAQSDERALTIRIGER
ncbi:MAG: hypothetical protein AAF607_08225 [Pseudomonadota bacterium]